MTATLLGSAALVTGGNSGIGRATAVDQAARGAPSLSPGATLRAATKSWLRSGEWRQGRLHGLVADQSGGHVDILIDARAGYMAGANRLPNDAGLAYKVLGMETEQVRAKVREFWGVVRHEALGAAIPEPRAWL